MDTLRYYPVFPSEKGKNVIIRDTFPPIPPELEGKMLDTIITFDPDTYTETIEYIESTPNTDMTSKLNQANSEEIDTLIIFNATTFEETTIIINNSTGVRDTID